MIDFRILIELHTLQNPQLLVLSNLNSLKRTWQYLTSKVDSYVPIMMFADQFKTQIYRMDIEGEAGDRKNKSRVKVAIRARPMISRELISLENTCIQFPSKSEIIIGNDRKYKFDRCFKESSTQDEVYEECIKDLILGCFQGYNAAVLAYGQTGSGKTYTMGTNTTTMDCNEEGMIPKVIHQIFTEIEKRNAEAEFTVKASFLEIYNEQIIDLLEAHKNIKAKDNGISIRQEKDGSVSIYGIIEENVTDSAQMMSLLDRGSINRTTAATMMNESSSRSHAIFTIFIEQHPLHQEDQGFITAKFFFVDLAGSERAKKTGATGVTLKEGININLGLLELGNVISALASDKKEAQFITYRNSKLTRILQDSLGGNSNTYMIACISPAESNYEQSLNTLKYASKAMNIKNKPVINRDPHSAMVNQLRQRIAELQQENKKLKQLLQGQGIHYQPIYNDKHSNNEEELRGLHGKLTVLERKNQKVFMELKQEKKRKNQLQIQAYQMQRERDILSSLLEQVKTNHPQIQFEMEELLSRQNIPLIENYLNKIQQLQTEILDKEKINTQLQIEYTKLHEISERDEQILIKKNESIYNLARQNKELKKAIKEMKKEFERSNGIEQQNEADEDDISIIHEILEEDSLDSDHSFNQQYQAFNKQEEMLKTELKSVECFITEKENFLSKITNEQMDLQYKLIEQMKEEYHQKISELEKEKNQLIKQQRNEINSTNTVKYAQKIDHLEIELRQYRNKVKEQKTLEQKLVQQNNVIKNLGNEIKTFKVQKIELNRRLKEDKDNFQKFKQKRTQQLLHAKRQNARKDVQIRKLTNENKRKAIVALKKTDQIKRIKKINDTLKRLMKPVKSSYRNSLKSDREREDKNRQSCEEEKELQNMIEICLKNMLLKIDRDFDLDKYEKKCDEISSELQILVRDESNMNLKIERLQIEEDEYDFDHVNFLKINKTNAELKLNLNEMRERISNLEENLQFCRRKYEELLTDQESKYQYSYESQIIYNPHFNNVNALRDVLKMLFRAVEKILSQNYELKIANQEVNLKNNLLVTEIEELKENIMKINLESQQNLSRLREEMMFRMYENELQEQNNGINEGNNRAATNGNQNVNKLGDREKKNYERKIIELSKNNSKLSSEIEMLRRKCNIVQEKYQQMRSLFNKDKFIGRPPREEENNINYPNNNNYQKDPRNKYGFNTPTSFQHKISGTNSSFMEQINTIAENLRSNTFQRVKKNLNFIEESGSEYNDNKDIPNHSYNNRLELNKYKWECVATIDAHSSPILAVKNYKHLLVSSATRNVRLWDLETNQLSSDITGINLNSFVRCLAISNEKQLLAAACDKIVTLWDLRTSNNEGVLRGHKDEIRAMHIVNNYLFTAGKGLTNSGSLLVWDLRYLNFNVPMEEKERNQDIFSMTSYNNILYYGTRDHHVRRLNIDSMQTLTTFQPPHMDAVTGLATSRGYLISGSKDKNLRLWSLDNSIYNLKSTVHAFNDYINTVQSDSYHPVFYSGDRTGQVKVGTILKEKIEFIGMFSHTQAVNAICSLEFNRGLTATGSADKTIKLWQPTSETFHQIQTQLC